jgi:gluconate 2-dehydrogenase gamma chain
MAGQGLERREVLRMLAAASTVAACSGFDRWSYAFGAPGQAPGAAAATGYAPRFFTAEEYALLATLAAHIIPADDTPGASEAGVSEFIDTMVAHDVPLQPRFRSGLAWLQARSRLLHGRPFEALSAGDQVAFLEALAYAAKHRPGEEEGRRFFALAREYTVMGYYTSRVGLEALGYPGLQLYSESPACPDPADATHQHRRVLARGGHGR